MQRRAELSAVIGEHTFIERIKFNRSGLTPFQRRMNIQAVYSKAVRFILGTFKTGKMNRDVIALVNGDTFRINV